MLNEFKTSQSLLDYLTRLMPGIKDFRIITIRPTTNNKAAKALFSIWKDENNTIDAKTLKKPSAMTSDEVEFLEREGLIKAQGEHMTVTDKGQEIIKTMILGDDKSVYEDNGEVMDLAVAMANTKPKRRTIKLASVVESKNWYRKLQ